MRLLLFVLFTICAVCTTKNLLLRFEDSVAVLREEYINGDTSHAFSIAMRLFVATQTLYNQLNLQHSYLNSQNIPKTCPELLSQVYALFSINKWTQIYQEIYTRLFNLHSHCTNSDFAHSSEHQLQGFDDKCALCAVLTRIMENYIVYHRKDVVDFIEKQFCSLFDGMLKPTCEAFTHYVGPTLIKHILNKQNSDVVCLKAGFCKNPQCKIVRGMMSILPASSLQQFSKPAPWQWLVHLFTDHFGDKHLPPFDLDNDTFSDISTFRGYHWRGSDCNELDAKIYPGRKTKTESIYADHDCNGIYGTDIKGKPFEELLCADTKRYGVVVIGDSAGAHFSIPEKYFNVSMMQQGTFHDLLYRVADQLDLPHESAYTGHTYTRYLSHSVYKYLRNWNLCNNNDYQNLGVNGGDSGNTWGNIKALKRDPKNDHPLLMFMQLIGNDVCSKSFDGMTKPEDFKRNIIKLLQWLDTTVPAGSHLMIVGLADGNLLYDYLHDSIHPLNVTYSVVYDFLNCLKISPCWGWLNSDQQTRVKTTQRAKQLSKMYQQIIDQGHTFINFDIVYYEFPTEDILQRKIMQGGDPKDMIERCDGFHPSGEFNSFLADWFWQKILVEHPEWIGPQNPHNQEIKKVFGLHDLI